MVTCALQRCVYVSCLCVANQKRAVKSLDVSVNQISLLQLLSNAAIARAGIVYTSSVQGVLSWLELESPGPDCGRVVVLNWQRPPRIDGAISETVTELARVSLWPDCSLQLTARLGKLPQPAPSARCM